MNKQAKKDRALSSDQKTKSHASLATSATRHRQPKLDELSAKYQSHRTDTRGHDESGNRKDRAETMNLEQTDCAGRERTAITKATTKTRQKKQLAKLSSRSIQKQRTTDEKPNQAAKELGSVCSVVRGNNESHTRPENAGNSNQNGDDWIQQRKRPKTRAAEEIRTRK
jgi:hypothetical protein